MHLATRIKQNGSNYTYSYGWGRIYASDTHENVNSVGVRWKRWMHVFKMFAGGKGIEHNDH